MLTTFQGIIYSSWSWWYATSSKPVKLYPNEKVLRVIAFIPPGHHHARFVIELEDQVIVLHEAAVAAIARSYVDITTHPSRKAVELVLKHFGKHEKKQGYSPWQLVETGKSEEEVIKEGLEVLAKALSKEFEGVRE